MSIHKLLIHSFVMSLILNSSVVQAAMLQSGDLLTIGSGSWFGLDNMDGQIVTEETALIYPGTDGGVRIGSNYGEQMIGSFDTWTWLGITGHHYSTSPITGSTESGLNFNGWSVYWNAQYYSASTVTDFGAWTPTNCDDLGCGGVSFVSDVATFSWSGVYGDSYSLWYSWSFQNYPGCFCTTDYLLHLVGTVEAAPAVVPVPAAIWLFGSGVMCLFGVAVKRRCNS